jgi:hypothetical protein
VFKHAKICFIITFIILLGHKIISTCRNSRHHCCNFCEKAHNDSPTKLSFLSRTENLKFLQLFSAFLLEGQANRKLFHIKMLTAFHQFQSRLIKLLDFTFLSEFGSHFPKDVLWSWSFKIIFQTFPSKNGSQKLDHLKLFSNITLRFPLSILKNIA